MQCLPRRSAINLVADTLVCLVANQIKHKHFHWIPLQQQEGPAWVNDFLCTDELSECASAFFSFQLCRQCFKIDRSTQSVTVTGQIVRCKINLPLGPLLTARLLLFAILIRRGGFLTSSRYYWWPHQNDAGEESKQAHLLDRPLRHGPARTIEPAVMSIRELICFHIWNIKRMKQSTRTYPSTSRHQLPSLTYRALQVSRRPRCIYPPA